tara:strand:- start:187 stop:303 length:117 start_codon:yes stop_codon:yes gene_type:complete
VGFLAHFRQPDSPLRDDVTRKLVRVNDQLTEIDAALKR